MKNIKSEGPTLSCEAEGSSMSDHYLGQVGTPLTRSESPARQHMSSAREPGGLQLALPGLEPGEHAGKARKGGRPVRRLEESDGPIVPEKPANKAEAAESVEERGPVTGNVAQGNPHRTQGRIIGGTTGLRRLRVRSGKLEAKKKLTSLFTHLRVDLFEAVYQRLKKNAAPGVDGVTWAEYGVNLVERLTDLQDRLHRGAYRPPAVRRTWIPKADGTRRPLGIPTVEDKVVQGAVVALLTPIYEAKFVENSYGFRPGRNQHQALDAVEGMMYRGYVNWVFDVDISRYFDSISHEWLVKMLEHLIGDRRLVRLVQRWLKAGVIEAGEWMASEVGSPQGGCVSPLLANIYLHYVMDVWFEQERRQMRGKAHMVRFADDVVFGFQHRDEAKLFEQRLAERLAKFGLQLHPDKTRLIRFGQFAHLSSVKDGRRKPETFTFLGFTHICARSQNTGKFRLLRRTAGKKVQRKLAEVKQLMRLRMHWRLADQWSWLCSVLRGHYNYYGLPGNFRALKSFFRRVWYHWHKVLQRRSQRAKMTRSKLEKLDRRYPLTRPRILRRQGVLRIAPQT